MITRASLAKKVLAYEATGVALMVVFDWANEVIDLPYRFLGAAQTPINWRESLLESAVDLGVGIAVIALTVALFRRIRYLEGFRLVCSWCRRIKVGERWIGIEEYLSTETAAKVEDGLCPDCSAPKKLTATREG
jgi:hypothetical protein